MHSSVSNTMEESGMGVGVPVLGLLCAEGPEPGVLAVVFVSGVGDVR